MIGHRDEDNQDGEQHHPHHEIVHILPFVLKSQPSGKRCTQLPQNHKEQVDTWLTDAPLYVEFVPAFIILGFQPRSDVTGGLHTGRIPDKGEQVNHHQHHPQKAHQQTAKRQQKNAVRLGANITEDIHERKSYQAHHLLPSNAHQPVKKRSKSRHPDGSDEVGELYMLGYDTQSTHHLGAVDGINAPYCEDWDE